MTLDAHQVVVCCLVTPALAAPAAAAVVAVLSALQQEMALVPVALLALPRLEGLLLGAPAAVVQLQLLFLLHLCLASSTPHPYAHVEGHSLLEVEAAVGHLSHPAAAAAATAAVAAKAKPPAAAPATPQAAAAAASRPVAAMLGLHAAHSPAAHSKPAQLGPMPQEQEAAVQGILHTAAAAVLLEACSPQAVHHTVVWAPGEGLVGSQLHSQGLQSSSGSSLQAVSEKHMTHASKESTYVWHCKVKAGWRLWPD